MKQISVRIVEVVHGTSSRFYLSTNSNCLFETQLDLPVYFTLVFTFLSQDLSFNLFCGLSVSFQHLFQVHHPSSNVSIGFFFLPFDVIFSSCLRLFQVAIYFRWIGLVKATGCLILPLNLYSTNNFYRSFISSFW